MVDEPSGEAAEAGPIRVLIADDHPVVRDGLRAMLDEPGIEVVGDASTGEHAVDRVGPLDADVVLMDVRMPDMDGLTATRLIKEQNAGVAVIVITSFESQDYLRQAVDAGAAGYLLKGMKRSLLVESIRVVRDGGSIFDPSMLASLLQNVNHKDPAVEGALDVLTEREREVLHLVARGQTNREIADVMGYSVGTIKNAVQRVIEKLEVSDRTQAAVLAVRAGLKVD
jgi:DNA-binding NarL/FixJ family response regulator